MAGRSTTAPVNVAAVAAKATAAIAAKKTAGLHTRIAIGAMIAGAAAVGIFAGSKFGVFDSTPADAGETGPPSAAAPAYQAGDTLNRATAISKARARAQSLVGEYQNNMSPDAARQASIAALIREAKAAGSRDAAGVFLNLAMQLDPNNQTAARLMAALGSTVATQSNASGSSLGGDFLLDDSARNASVASVSASNDSGSTGGPDGATSPGQLPSGASGVNSRLSDAANTVVGAGFGADEGAAPAGGVVIEAEAEGGGLDPGGGAGPAPTPIAIPTAASSGT